MNLYIRYFDDETVVTNLDDAFAFISTFDNFQMTPQFVEDFRQYAESSMPYPKRYKVHSRVYFIVIKTTANTLEEFKANGKSNKDDEAAPAQQDHKKAQADVFNAVNPGWYETTVRFKRVFVNDAGKCEYLESDFTARLKAVSPQDSYNRVIDYLRSREDIDPRSQFPSIKGKNFTYSFLGLKPMRELPI
ncbi:MAG: hypothetical protein J5486_06440 [Bacteroidaceae bacterium]|nr:hypothetical protein [Bacteroidaceae bacterium]